MQWAANIDLAGRRGKAKGCRTLSFGPVWAALCHQRGILPLHASAIVTKNGIAAFAGHSGAGKSTIAALMGSLGYALVADDIVPVSFREGSPPGAKPFSPLKLQLDPIIQLALPSTELVKEVSNRKYFVSPKITADDEWIRLERIDLLEVDGATSGASIDQITGPGAVRVIIDQTNHFQFILQAADFATTLHCVHKSIPEVAVYRLCRPPDFDIGELRFLLRETLEGQPANRKEREVDRGKVMESPYRLRTDWVVQRDSNIIASEADQDLVMVSIENGFYYGLSNVGREIWEAIEYPEKNLILLDELSCDL